MLLRRTYLFLHRVAVPIKMVSAPSFFGNPKKGETATSMVQGTCWSTSRIAPKRCVVVERCRILPASRPLGLRLRRHWGDRIEPLACAIHKVWVRWFRKCNHCSIAVFSPPRPLLRIFYVPKPSKRDHGKTPVPGAVNRRRMPIVTSTNMFPVPESYRYVDCTCWLGAGARLSPCI